MLELRRDRARYCIWPRLYRMADHELDLPVMANTQDVMVHHYILDLNCDLQQHKFQGSVLMFLDTVKEAGRNRQVFSLQEVYKWKCSDAEINLDKRSETNHKCTGPNETKNSEKPDKANALQEQTFTTGLSAAFHKDLQCTCKCHKRSTFDPKADELLLKSQTLKQDVQYDSHRLSDDSNLKSKSAFSVATSTASSSQGCILDDVQSQANHVTKPKDDTLTCTTPKQNNKVCCICSSLLQSKNSGNTVMSNLAQDQNDDNIPSYASDAMNNAETENASCKSNNTGTESEKSPYKFILECCDIDVHKVEEVIPPPSLAARLQSSVAKDLETNKTDFLACKDLTQTRVLEHCVEKWCLKMWRPGVTVPWNFPRLIRIHYSTRPKGQSLRWTVDQDLK